jgi:hypothetical protein
MFCNLRIRRRAVHPGRNHHNEINRGNDDHSLTAKTNGGHACGSLRALKLARSLVL